jgi:hypothetical protein
MIALPARFAVPTRVLAAVPWIGGGALLLAASGYLVLGHGHAKRSEADDVIPHPASVIAILGDDGGVQTHGVLARPIFHQDRVFIQPRPVQALVAPPPPPTYALAGYMAMAGKPPTAVLRNTLSNRSIRVKVGDRVDEWEVLDVGPRAVTLGRDSHVFTITPQGSSPAGGGVPAHVGGSR